MDVILLRTSVIVTRPRKQTPQNHEKTGANRRHSIFAASVPLVWDIQSSKVGKLVVSPR